MHYKFFLSIKSKMTELEIFVAMWQDLSNVHIVIQISIISVV